MKHIFNSEKLEALCSAFSARKAGTRLLALLLALVLLQGDFILPAYATESESSDTSVQTTTPETNVPSVQEQAELPVNEDTLVITLDGVETSVLELFEYEKMEICAEGLEQQADYQWQILHPENGTWINIYDATEQSISVSAALVKNMLNEDGSAALRCRAYTEEYAYPTDSIHITLLEEPETASVQLFSLDDEAVPMAEGDTTPEFITVTIEYKLYGYAENDKGEYVEQYLNEAFTPYIATLKSGTTLNASSVHCPTIVGFEPILTKVAIGGVERDPTDDEFNVTTQEVQIMDLTTVSSDVVYTVEYHPADVPYEVHYYFQNIYDDLYTEDTNIQSTIHAEGKTGTKPDATYTEAVFSGFTSLYYEPETIAADGSTVFNVYYERNYYLMEFDCNDGFGTDTIYVRYGTYVSVPNPVRPGWTFNGWDLVDTEQIFENETDKPNLGTDADGDGRLDGDGVANMPLPTTMPPYSSAYKALWGTTDTTYTVAYWIDNGDGTYTSIGSRKQDEESNKVVSGADDLTNDMNVCGLVEHNHATSGCYYACGKTVHAHDDGNCQYDCDKIVHAHNDGNCVYDCGKTEHIHTDGTCDYSSCDKAHTHGDGNCTYSCGYNYEHSHGDGNCDCNIELCQTHTRSCYTFSGYNVAESASSPDSRNLSEYGYTPNEALPVYRTRYGTYYILINGNYYQITSAGNFNINNLIVTRTCHTAHDASCCTLHTHTDNCYSCIEHFHTYSCCNRETHTHTDCTCVLAEHTHGDTCGNCILNEHAHSETCYHCGLVDHIHGADCKTDISFLEFVSADQNVLVEGDGSTVINVYYAYKTYTLKFYYAISQDTNSDGTGDTFRVVGGSTWPFGSRADDDIDKTNDLTLLQQYTTGSQSGQTGLVKTLPALNELGQQRVATGKYKLGSTTSGNYTYYYLYFNARYGSDISDLWPCSVFDSVKVNFTPSGKDDNWTGTTATVSAWNGEYYVKYSRDTSVNNDNQTIKGKYEVLDENLLWWNYTVNGETVYADLNETYDGSIGTVSYLCFWENGSNTSWSVPELYRYNIYLEAPNGVVPPGYTTTAVRDGITFYLIDSYDTCDNSTVGEQTQPGLTGYTPIYFVESDTTDDIRYEQVKGSDPARYFEYQSMSGTTDTELLKQSGYYNSTLYNKGYTINFYFVSTEYTLSYFNHTEYLSDIDVATDGSQIEVAVPYANNLADYMALADSLLADAYPDTLEPNAYRFAGWYTTAECLEKSEFGTFHYTSDGLYSHSTYENVTMPAGNLTLYAKWEPVKRNVYFHFLYSDIATGTYWYVTDEDGNKVTDAEGNSIPKSYPIVVDHGTLLGTTYAFTPIRVENGKEYTFVGWFYMDENGKKRFAPDTMEIRQDLHLFAEWQSGIDTQYEVTYVLKEDAKVEDITYPAGTVVAEASAGHLTAGKTKTFTAKAGSELLPTFADMSLFPDTNSHSILMSDTPTDNTFQFNYVMDDQVWYKIKYLDKSDNSVLHEEYVYWTNKAVITPKFEPIRGYIPDQYYIRKVLASDGATGSRDNVLPENEIIFYYTKDNDHGLYTILYYTENLDGTWYQDQSELGSDDLVDANGNAIVISRDIPTDKYNGFTYDHAEVTTYTYNKENDEYVSSTTSTTDTLAVGGTLSAGGLEIRIYYKRNSYPYIIKFMQYGTSKVLGYSQVNDTNLYTLESISQTIKPTALFDSTITYTAPTTITQGEYTYLLVSDSPQSKKIRVEEIPETKSYNDLIYNQLTFYYDVKKTTVQYEARCTVPSATDFGIVSPNSQTVATTNQLHATATPGSGFEFVGWYNASTDTAVNVDWVTSDNGSYHFKPTVFEDPDGDGVVTYYALFKPTLSSLTINKTVLDANDNVYSSSDTFLFSVKGTGKHKYLNLTVAIHGNGSITIDNLPVGDYAVTELTAWSYEYSPKETSIQTEVTTGGTEVTFTNVYKDSDWLNGECQKENDFSNPTT